jgi:hypothetical protein
MEYVGSRLDVFGVDVECLSMGLRSVVGRDHKDDAVAHAFVSLRRLEALGGWSGAMVGGGAAAR